MNVGLLPDPLSLSFTADPDDFTMWSQRVAEAQETLQVVASAPYDHRRYRPMRVSEIWQFAGISRRQWSDWCATKRTDGAEAFDSRSLSVEQMHQMMDELGVRPGKPANKRALRLLVSNFKGGAQKTTVSLQLAHYFGLRGYRVLVIDTDPQGTLTQHLGLSPSQVDDDNTIGVLYDDERKDLLGAAGLAPLPTHIDGVDIIPANLNLTTLDFQIAALFVNDGHSARRYPDRMNKGLQEIEDRYDLVLIDSPPAFSFVAICMAWIADAVIVPMPTQVPDFAGTGAFCEMMGFYTHKVEEWFGRKKEWSPVVFVHARVTGGGGTPWVLANSSAAFGHHRLEATIAESRPVANCLTRYKSVFEATSADSDAKGLARARDAFFALGKSIESLLPGGWALMPESDDEP